MLRTLGIVSFIVWIIPGFSFAGTYHVAKTGSDSVSCANADFAPDNTQAKPTIQAAVSCATAPGDTVIVHAGSYVETVSNWPASGASGNPITIRANTGDTVTWRGSGTDVSSLSNGAIYMIDRNYIRIEGFRFENNVTAATLRFLHGATTNKMTSPMVGIEIINNTFVNNGNNGSTAIRMSRQIYMQYVGRDSSYSGSTVNTIRGNTFITNFGANIDFDNTSDTLVENNTSTGNMGSREPSTANQYQTNLIQMGGSGTQRNIVEKNTVSAIIKNAYIGASPVEGTGIRMDVSPNNNILRRNTIFDLGNEGPGWDGTRHFYGIYCEANCNNNIIASNIIYRVNEACIAVGSQSVTRALGNKIFNNTVHTCGRIAIYIHHAQNTTIKNNIVAGTAAALVVVTPQSIALGGHVWSNNLWFKPGTTLFGLWNYNPDTSGYGNGNLNLSAWSSSSGETNSRYADPVFVNAAAGDFHLQLNSPATNAGTTLSEVTTDFDGVLLPYDCCYDIGAYEFGGTVTSPPPPSPPPSSSPLLIPGRIEAENYNTGGQNLGYFDTTTGNAGGACKTDSVDIKDVTGEGCTIGYTEPGEWLSYIVNVQNTGSYATSFRVANGSGSAQDIHLELDGTNISGPISIGSTGSYSTQITTTGPILNLVQGTHNLKLYFDTGLLDLNWMEFQGNAEAPVAPSGVQVSLPQ